MNKYSSNNPTGEWSRLIQQQNSQSDQQQQVLKYENYQRKLQYRQELQTAMQERNKKNSDSLDNFQYADQIQQSLQRQDFEQIQKLNQLKQKEAEFAKYSLEQQEIKKILQKQYNQNEKQQINEQMIKNQQNFKEELIEKQYKKNQIIYELNQSYKDMEDKKRIEQNKIKLFEKQSMQEEVNKLQQDEEQRRNFLNKLKHNYHQNEGLLEKYNQIYQQKEREKYEIDNKIIKEAAEQKRQQDEQRLIIERAIRQKKNKETYNSIMQQIEYKREWKEREQQQKSQELEYFGVVNEHYKRKDQDDLQRKLEKQKQYRQDLIMQIEEQQTKKKRDQSMSTVEMKINQNYYNNEALNVGIVPGIFVDHNRLKQQKYLDSNQTKRQNSQFQRQRNLSAYFPSNQIY
ncbi:unnamed protein product [Paramecium pentaurelia]|uniref:Trichohyalin-plectin-homology domain-containing protein n=1 Tax=Paramecium pentaurelia TaxID=43138 RepID=A0A8S1Y3Z1_9CILI|nr:unnamed protein product [Paramecium pentaurelia]